MRKILSLLSAITLTAITSTNVIACACCENNLNVIIKNKNLGNIYIGQLLSKPNKTQILNAIKDKNSRASVLTINDFECREGSATATSATIVGIGKYKGEITLNYKAQEFKKVTGWNENNGKILYLNVIFDGTIYVMTNKALYRTKTDDSFEKITGWDEADGTILNLFISSNRTIYVGSTFGLYKLSDFSFKMVSGIEGAKNFYGLTEINGTIYAGGASSISKSALYRSKTDGSFQKITKTDIGNFKSLVNVNGIIYAGVGTMNLYRIDKDGNVVWITNWNNGLLINLVNVNGVVYAVTAKGKIYKIITTNNNKIEEVTDWSADGVILDLIFTADERIYYVATDKNLLYRSKIDGTFEKITGWNEDEGNALSLLNINGTIYVGTDKGVLYESEKLNN